MKWPVVALGEVVEINPAGPRAGEMSEEELADFVPMASVSETGAMSVHERRSYAEVRKGFTIFRNGDVLLAKITPCYENNKIAKAVVTTAYAFGSTEFHVLRPHASKLDADYLTYFLRQDHIRAAGERRMTGSGGQRRVPKAFLEDLEIPLAPLSEQKRIAGILDQADALRRLRARALDRLNALGQAIFQEMFGEALARDFIAFGDVVEEFRYGTSNKSGNTGLPTLRIPNVIGGGIDTTEIKTVDINDAELKRLRLRDGDMLFVRTNGNLEHVGRCAVFTKNAVSEFDQKDDWIFASYLIRVRLLYCANSMFAAIYFASRAGRAAIRERSKTSAGQFNINTEGLASLPFPNIPRAQQDRFANALASLEHTRSPLKISAAKMAENFSSLQHRAFRGEL
ncbi:restriction endonuclease subunit S [Neomegalonema perideroedes]|uniref:restriction endonuclease subunit S n=1 Tax=Neomegalonema perideroedes TaxID=217219 RepID=UPI00036FEAD2|nr:restriction endonuclease subunit S [Neomegalonema perideroedes]